MLLLITLGAGLLVGFVAISAVFLLRSTNIRSAEVGDCLRYAESTGRFRPLECGRAGADFRVYGVTDSIRDCVDVAGTTRAFEVDAQAYCIGESNADLAKAINGVKVGECVVLQGEQAEKSPCGPGRRPVLLVKQSVLRSTSTNSDLAYQCLADGAEGTEQVYAWSLASQPGSPIGTYDRVFCLGPTTT